MKITVEITLPMLVMMMMTMMVVMGDWCCLMMSVWYDLGFFSLPG